jgi:hypothetical protein
MLRLYRTVLLVAIVTPIICLRGQNQSTRQIQEGIKNHQNYEIEMRKIELEERRLYLVSLQGSRITEAKAREVSEWILRNLKDYPRGKKAKHADEDLRFLIEAIAALQKSN